MIASLALLVLPQAPVTTQDPNPVASVEHLITKEGIAACVRYLSDDLLEGRGVGTRGDKLARRYLASQMELFGMKPGGLDGTWEQPVSLFGITAKVLIPMTVTGPKGKAVFTAPKDYTAESGHPGANSEWKDADVVFVGYGIDAPEQKWDDYKGVDLKGKVVLVMNNDPSSDPNLFAGPTRLYYGRWSYKFEEAARRGAVGAIVIHTTRSAGYPFQVIQNGHGREDFWLPFKPADATMAVRSWCSEEAARKMAALGGHDLDALRKVAETRAFKPVPLGVRINLNMSNRVRRIDSANVIGKLEGSDAELKSEAVVVTAHFDHLGIRAPKNGDSIYNGALDNASGCAGMLTLVRACGALKIRPKRTILFTFVTAEESGLLGSLYFARNPTYPRKKIVANYNLDSINIWGATKDIAMVGYGKNSLTGVADKVARRRGRVLIANPDVSLGLFYRSDHFSFARVGIPSAYFKAGSDFYVNRRGKNLVKGAYTRTRYHQPNDEFHDKWDLRGAVEDMRLVLECILVTANADDAPKWSPGDEFEKLR
jgi:Zn-dependent M28 family amino/carboxypeptidase